MAVNSGWDFEAPKSASIHQKKVLHTAPGVNKAFWSEAMRLCKNNIHILNFITRNL